MKIVLLAGKGELPTFIYNGLNNQFPVSNVIIEETVSRKKLVKNRIKKLGYFKVINQLLFQFIISRILRLMATSRIKFLKNNLDLIEIPIPHDKITHVDSINSDSTVTLIKKINPEIVLVSGTRIINSKVLNRINSLFINTHVGITPQYRGVHGAYWALAKNDPENCGVTIHKIDDGIDTGDIIAQKTIAVTNEDNFSSYVYLQIAEAIPLLITTLETLDKGCNISYYKKPDAASKLYYHPTCTGYLYRRVVKGIK